MNLASPAAAATAPTEVDAIQRQTTIAMREWLGVLVLSTSILRRHGAALGRDDRLAQREMMQEAGAHLVDLLQAEENGRRSEAGAVVLV